MAFSFVVYLLIYSLISYGLFFWCGGLGLWIMRISLISLVSKFYTSLMYPISFLIAILFRIFNISHLLSFYTTTCTIALVPGRIGILVRRVWYKMSLRKCGKKLFIEFGAVIIEKESEIGDNVFIGPFSHIDLVEIGDDALISQGVVISGAKNAHGSDKNSIMRLQEGYKRKVIIGDDVWVGMKAVVLEDVSRGCIISCLSFVNKKFPEYSVIGGVPCRLIKER